MIPLTGNSNILEIPTINSGMIESVVRGHISTLLNSTMVDIEKLEKPVEVDKKEIAKYKQMYEQLNKKARLLYKENESIKKQSCLQMINSLEK